MIIINDITENHARDAAGTEYENECIIRLASGGSIRTPAYPDSTDYVRVCDDEGRELMYWSSDEFGELDEAFGAFLGLAKQVAEATPTKS